MQLILIFCAPNGKQNAALHSSFPRMMDDMYYLFA